MNEKNNIWVEGNEFKFLQDYLNLLNIDEGKYSIFESGGKDNIFSDAKLKTLNRQKEIILIFDADNQDCEIRKKEILERIDQINKTKGYEILVKGIFLMPNDSDNGEFENLLFEIMNPTHRDEIFECFERYLSCIKEKEYCPKDEKQMNKTKVYIFNEALDFEKKEIHKPKKTDYTNKDHWDLDHDYLNPLKTFLENNIK